MFALAATGKEQMRLVGIDLKMMKLHLCLRPGERARALESGRVTIVVGEIESKGTDAFVPGSALKPGIRLVREWGGHMHTVIVREDGFDYDGEHYASLTKIATRITGAHWSGPRFFGIRKAASRSPAGGDRP